MTHILTHENIHDPTSHDVTSHDVISHDVTSQHNGWSVASIQQKETLITREGGDLLESKQCCHDNNIATSSNTQFLDVIHHTDARTQGDGGIIEVSTMNCEATVAPLLNKINFRLPDHSCAGMDETIVDKATIEACLPVVDNISSGLCKASVAGIALEEVLELTLNNDQNAPYQSFGCGLGVELCPSSDHEQTISDPHHSLIGPASQEQASNKYLSNINIYVPTQPSEVVPVPTQPSEAVSVPTQPSEAVPVPTQPSEAVPVPTQPSEVVPVPTQPSEAVPVPTQPSEVVSVPTQPSEAVSVPTQPSEVVPVPTQPSEVVPVPTQPSEVVSVPTQPSEVVSVPTQPSEVVPVPTQPSEVVSVPTQPSEVVPVPTQPSEVVPVPTQPSEAVFVPTPPSEAVSVPIQPSEVVPVPTQPSEVVSVPTQPSEVVSVPTQPSEVVPVPTQPSEVVSVPTQPSEVASVPTQPSEAVPVPTQPSEVVPVPTQPSEVVSVPTQPSEVVPVPTQPSEVVPVPTQPSEVVSVPTQPSEVVPVPTQPSEVVPVPTQPSEAVFVPTPPSEAVSVPIQPSEVVPVPTQPSEVVSVPTQPSEVVSVPTQPSEVVSVPTQPSEVVPVPTQPSEVVSVPTQPSEVASVPTPPSEVVSVPTQPSEVVLVPTQPSEVVPVPTQPSEVVPVPTQPSEAVFVPTPPSEAVSVPTQPSEVVPVPIQPSEAVSVPTQPSEVGVSTQPSEAVPVPTQPSEAVPVPTQPSEVASVPTQPSEVVPVPTQPSEVVPVPTQPFEVVTAPTQPSEVASVPTQPSEVVPVPTQPSEVVPVTTQPSEVVPVPTQPFEVVTAPTQPSEVVPVPTQPSEVVPVTTQPSEVVPVPTQPFEVVTAPTQPSEVVPVPTQPSEVASVPTQPSEMVPVPTQPSEAVSVPTQPSEVVPVPIQPSEVVSVLTGMTSVPTQPFHASEKTVKGLGRTGSGSENKDGAMGLDKLELVEDINGTSGSDYVPTSPDEGSSRESSPSPQPPSMLEDTQGTPPPGASHSEGARSEGDSQKSPTPSSLEDSQKLTRHLEKQVSVSLLPKRLSFSSKRIMKTLGIIGKRPTQFDDTQHSVELTKRVTSLEWDPACLLEELYADHQRVPHVQLALTGETARHFGYMEKLPVNQLKPTMTKKWKRRYFRIMEGNIYYYERRTDDKALNFFRLENCKLQSEPKKLQAKVTATDGSFLVMRVTDENDLSVLSRAIELESTHPTICAPLAPQATLNNKVVIIDIGATSVRAGFAGKNVLPQLFFPAVCCSHHMTSEIFACGHGALLPDNRTVSDLIYPRRTALRMDKRDANLPSIAYIVRYVLTQLNAEAGNTHLVMTLPLTASDKDKHALAEMLFDTVGIMALCFQDQALLSLYSYNTTSGVLVDIGDHIDIVPMQDGFIVESGVYRLPFGGNAITEHLSKLITTKGVRYFSETEAYITRLIKESMCYVSQNYAEDLERCDANVAAYTQAFDVDRFHLPDHRKVIALDSALFKAPEGLLNPSLWGKDVRGLHELLWESVQACPIDQRRGMLRSIYLSGGTSRLRGLKERLEAELRLLAPSTAQVQVHVGEHSNHAAFMGGCVLATLDSFSNVLVTRDEWNNMGVEAFRKMR